MARINTNIIREASLESGYFGKGLIFCEGKTEYNYFHIFYSILGGKLSKFTNVELELENAEGNAQTVFTYAESFLNNEANRAKYRDYDKYLVFDCDDPENIDEVLIRMQKSPNNYRLAPTNLLFELWLVMHFQDIDSPLTKAQTYKALARHLNIEYYGSAGDKNNTGFRR